MNGLQICRRPTLVPKGAGIVWYRVYYSAQVYWGLHGRLAVTT